MADGEIIIVGAGPAGVAAALQLDRLGRRARLLEARGRIGGLLHCARRIANYPGLVAPVPGPVLCERMQTQLTAAGIAVETDRVCDVAPSSERGRLRVTTEATVHTADGVVVAVGTSPRRLGLRNEAAAEGRRVFYEVAALRSLRPARAAVIGGGEAAFDSALSLADLGAVVSIWVRADRPRVRGRLLDEVMQSSQITVHCGCAVERLQETANGVDVALSGPTGEIHIPVDAVLVAVGRTSAATPLVSAFADATCAQREAAGLLVVGDASRGALGQAGIAVGDGLDAAMRIAQRWAS